MQIKMDVSTLFKTVNNLNDYIIATQEVINQHNYSKIQFNMSTVLSLTKIRSLEIEYFNKCDESGAGVRILELILRLPPSKTWSILGKEIILLFQYWLEAIRKHLILHNNHWWNFLSVLLDFILKTHLKHSVLANILVHELTDCLLDLATSSKPSIFQRQKILQCFNTICAESGREIRLAVRNKFEHYFVKLSSILPTCGDIRVQFCILETLLRWLIPRQDLLLKKEAVARWFPNDLYDEACRSMFLERSWQNFLKDARDFLNCTNERYDHVTTVTCRRFTVGNVSLINGTKDYYLDLNSGTKCILLIVEPSLSDVLGKSDSETVVISKDNTNIIRMYRESSEILISVNIVDPQLLYPSDVLRHNDIQLVISTKNIKKLNDALRNIFDIKYELLMDLESSVPNSQNEEHVNNEGTRYSHQVETNKSKHSGYIVRKKSVSWKSPSSASTSSLAMLRDKLRAFPSYKFDKEPVSVCALPQLSSVTELTEEDRYSLNATLSMYKVQTYGVCNKTPTNKNISEKENEEKSVDQINNDEDSVSCLLVATIGSNESVINDTLERLPKDKEIHTDNIVELLAKEALQDNINKLDSGVVSNDKSHEINTNKITKDKIGIIQETINSDTSNSVVEGTQLTNKDNPLKIKTIHEVGRNKKTFDIKTVEDFFSQHYTEIRDGDLLISPSLAKKLNETSSEGSLDFDVLNRIESNNYEIFNFDNTEIVECLNNMVDKVCEDLDKCTEYLTKEIDDSNKDPPKAGPMKGIQNNGKKSKQNVNRLKLQYKNTKPKQKKQTKLVTEKVKRMTTIVERDSEVEKSVLKDTPELKEQSVIETPLIKRKRKLYSPNDNRVNEKTGILISETEDDNSLFITPTKVDKTPKTVATPYDDIEKIRRSSSRTLRNRNFKIRLSPRSLKMNEMFDNLKKTVEGEEKIKLADKKTSQRSVALYNFSSDSEDDFRRTNDLKKKTSGITNVDTIKTRARSKNARNATKKTNNSTPETKKRNGKQKQKKNTTVKKHTPNRGNDLIDERMRDATDMINTSIIIDNNKEVIHKELEPIVNKPEMEVIHEDTDKRVTRRRRNLSLKKDKEVKNCDKDQSARSSPLPGLIIETVDVEVHKDGDDSITVTMLEKYKDIYENGALPDLSEINTTSNLLSDLKQVSYDPILNMTEELDVSRRSKKRSRTDEDNTIVAKKSKSSELKVVNISDEKSETTIETLGKSPITGHGDLDESPPNPKYLKERVEPRGLETEDLNQSMKNFFDTLTKQIYEESNTLKSKLQEDIESNETPLKPKGSTVSPTVSITRLSPKDINRWRPRYNSIFGSNQSSDSDVPVRITRSYTSSQKQKNVSETEVSPNVKRKSIISPIKMFGEVTKETSIPSEQDYLEHIKKLMTNNIPKAKAKTESKYNSHAYRETDKISASTSAIQDSDKLTSPVFKLSTKGHKSDFESGPSSSVDDWFNRNEHGKQSKAENLGLSLKDNLEHILEKLDTTLTEIHHKTNKGFVNMFVDAQKHLTDLKETRRQLYKNTAVNILTDVVNVMDSKFADLEQRFQDVDEKFIKSLKEKANNLMREDCKQKRVMVNLMKEDVQAALDHIRDSWTQ